MVLLRISLVYYVFFISAIFISLKHCRILQKNDKDIIVPSEFNKLSRAEQIKRCASCHKTEYESEMKGPHANAYHMLTEHSALVNSKNYDYPEYAHHVNVSYTTCEKCHAAKNLFETLFRGYKSPDSLTQSLYTIALPFPEVRTDTSTKTTGIDCITCHYNGKNVITTLGNKNLSNAWCLPEKSAFFSGNMSCYPCHYDDVKTFQTQLPQSNTIQSNCSNCHLEKNKSGQGTHYYYWRYNSKYGKPSPVFDALLSDFEPIFGRRTTDSVSIVWKNKYAPHQMADGPELVIVFDVLGEDSNVLATKQLRLNRKKEHDKMMFVEMGKKNMRGIEGVEIPLNGDSIIITIPLKNKNINRLLHISAVSKAQYWLSDTIGKTVSERYVNF